MDFDQISSRFGFFFGIFGAKSQRFPNSHIGTHTRNTYMQIFQKKDRTKQNQFFSSEDFFLFIFIL